MDVRQALFWKFRIMQTEARGHTCFDLLKQIVRQDCTFPEGLTAPFGALCADACSLACHTGIVATIFDRRTCLADVYPKVQFNINQDGCAHDY